jgi:hypothetical protein
LPRSISPQGRKAEPVVARQFEQWQLYAERVFDLEGDGSASAAPAQQRG